MSDPALLRRNEPSAPACTCTPSAVGPVGSGGRFGPTHTLILLIAFLGLGSGLFLSGAGLETVLALLGGLGTIGAATLAAARGGRRRHLAGLLVEALARSGAGK